MSSRLVRIASCLALVVVSSASVFAATPQCNRACLDGILDQYLKAVVKHDPSAAPLFVAFRQTENAIVVGKGDGVWKTVTGFGKVQRHYIDTVGSSAGYFGEIEEGSEVGIATLRLKIDSNRKITEAEWIIARADTGGPGGPGLGSTSPGGLESSPPPNKPLAKELRASRDAMVAITNSYFDSLQTGNNDLMIAHPGWIRLENGIGTGQGKAGWARGGTAGIPPDEAAANAPAGGRGRGGARGGAPGAAPGGGGRGTGGMTGVVARRYPVVDEEMGMVLGMVIFIRPPGSTARRNLLTEWFAIDQNKIRGIYAAMHYLEPTQAAPNWPPYDGNWPLAPMLPGMDGTPTQGGGRGAGGGGRGAQ